MTWPGWNGDNDPGPGCLLRVSRDAYGSGVTLWSGARRCETILGKLKIEDVVMFLGEIDKGEDHLERPPGRRFRVLSSLGVGCVFAHFVEPLSPELYDE